MTQLVTRQTEVKISDLQIKMVEVLDKTILDLRKGRSKGELIEYREPGINTYAYFLKSLLDPNTYIIDSFCLVGALYYESIRVGGDPIPNREIDVNPYIMDDDYHWKPGMQPVYSELIKEINFTLMGKKLGTMLKLKLVQSLYQFNDSSKTTDDLVIEVLQATKERILLG